MKSRGQSLLRKSKHRFSPDDRVFQLEGPLKEGKRRFLSTNRTNKFKKAEYKLDIQLETEERRFAYLMKQKEDTDSEIENLNSTFPTSENYDEEIIPYQQEIKAQTQRLEEFSKVSQQTQSLLDFYETELARVSEETKEKQCKIVELDKEINDLDSDHTAIELY